MRVVQELCSAVQLEPRYAVTILSESVGAHPRLEVAPSPGAWHPRGMVVALQCKRGNTQLLSWSIEVHVIRTSGWLRSKTGGAHRRMPRPAERPNGIRGELMWQWGLGKIRKKGFHSHRARSVTRHTGYDRQDVRGTHVDALIRD